MASEDKKTLELLERLRKIDPNLFFFITRSKNDNVVMYSANTEGGKLCTDDPVSVYWLDIDAEYVARARAEGRDSDRVELGAFERRMAYGIETRASPNKPGHFGAKLTAHRERTLTLYIDTSSSSNKHPQPRALINIHPTGAAKPESARLVRVHVETNEGLLQFNSVTHVDFYAQSLTTGKLLHERIIPQ